MDERELKIRRIKELLNELVDTYYDTPHNVNIVGSKVLEVKVVNDDKPPPSVSSEEEDNKSEQSDSIDLSGMRNIGYLPFWNKNNNDLSKYTHISLAFVDIYNDGSPNPKELKSIDLSNYKGKIGVSVGGATWSKRHINILEDDKKRKLFIDNLIIYSLTKNYDYINYDLEYPSRDLAEKLLRETQENMKRRGRYLDVCVAIGCWRDFVSPYKNCNQYLNWVELMFYDDPNILLHGKNAIQQLLDYGYPKDKIVIGYSLDKNGVPDNEETLRFKKSIEGEYGGKMLWEVTMKKEEDEESSEESYDESESESIDDGEYLFVDKWDNPYREMNRARTPDEYDKRTQFRGAGKCMIENGVMTLSGRQPRIYTNIEVQDVEAEVEFMRVGNDGKGWSGGNIGVRSHPEGHSTEIDKAHTYYFRLKHGQQLDFYREETHGGGAKGVVATRKFNWEGDRWYKMKFKCYNLTNHKVKLEGYINDKLELEHTDESKFMFDNRGVVFIRNTEIQEAKYKNFTIKSI